MAKNEYMYDVYDGENKIIKNKTLRQISEQLDIPLPTVRHSEYHKALMRDRFKLERIGVAKNKTEKFAEEWEDAVRPFRNITWVKSGGRKLEFKR